ncbi:sulfite exporter TauE/SafE family protein [Pseudidiomarina marina]|uniref:sulfite exporter TauE/SafE family protein n=1 Tax=Pseudidiomarina marina TaxID=502366 RepID=UPI003850024C
MDYLLITLIIFIGACLQGITGFGSGLIAVPLLTLLLPLSVITPTLSIINFAMATYLAWMLRHSVQIRQWRWLLLTGVIGTLAGNWLLNHIRLDWLQMGMAIMVITVALLFWFGVQLKHRSTPGLQSVTGLLAGFSNGALTLGGPPVVLFLTGNGLDRLAFRATLTIFFWVLALTNIVSFGVQQRYEAAHVPIVICLLIGAISGAWLGHKISDKLSERLFRKLSLLLVIIAGAIAFAGAWNA